MQNGAQQEIELPTFDDFRESWLEDVCAGNPSTVQLGQKFALKLINEWLDQSELSADYIYCDGSNDGGIDVALLDTGTDDPNDPNDQSGHTWYLIQSKYGSAFAGTSTLILEGQKVIDTLDGKKTTLNSLASGVIEKLINFRNQAGDQDKIVLMFGTEYPLTDGQQQTLSDLRAMGRDRLGHIFDVEAISLKTIYDRLLEPGDAASSQIEIQIDGNFVDSGEDLIVGSVGLIGLYNFLKKYRNETGDMDQIYEKNVRRFLGGKGRVNKRMSQTLGAEPEKFGLFNNGITIVTTQYVRDNSGALLVNPYIVNGCQTSRTIYDFMDSKLGAGGTGSSSEMESWKAKAAQGVVVTKVVRVGSSGDALLKDITRNTNSQNAVREKDFIALTEDFNAWKDDMADRFDIYLEIQRGGWDSQRALQKQGKAKKVYADYANASDLIKVYGAGWLAEVGSAFGKNQPFLPQGSIFKRIVNQPEGEGSKPFGSDDLYAAHLLQLKSKQIGFGRGAQESRRLSRFLFYFVCIDLLRDALSKGGLPVNLRDISTATISVMKNETGSECLAANALSIIDTYFSSGDDQSIQGEPAFQEVHGSNLNTFLKSEDFGRNMKVTPNLEKLILTQRQIMGMSLGGNSPARNVILSCIDESVDQIN